MDLLSKFCVPKIFFFHLESHSDVIPLTSSEHLDFISAETSAKAVSSVPKVFLLHKSRDSLTIEPICGWVTYETLRLVN